MENKDNLSETIAIIGLACQVPGAEDVDKFWSNLCESKCSIQEISAEKMRQSGIHDHIMNNNDYRPYKGVLASAFEFDREFFGYTVQEATVLDPQIRVFLQTAWHALEDASYVPRENNRVAVYASMSSLDSYYKSVQCNSALVETVGDQISFYSNHADFLATTIAYKLGLQGPCINIQTACSSSLVGVAKACESLLSYESDVALAGGVSISMPLWGGYTYKPGSIFSKAGKCQPFSDQSDGTVRGDGCGVVILKRLSDAIKDRDNIYGIIEGWAINNDGANKISYAAPSQDGQTRVIKEALLMSGRTPRSVAFIETHGTATALGDAIELASLKDVFENEKIILGAIKANIGHLDVASGIIGLIKCALIVKKHVIPPSLMQASSSVLPFEIYTDSVVSLLPNKSVGVSSFGIGGTNCHLVLGQYQMGVSESQGNAITEKCVIPLSANSKKSLDAMCVDYRQLLDRRNEISYASLLFSIMTGRKKMEYSACVQMLGDELVAKQIENKDYAVAFIFAGQGISLDNMPHLLYAHYPYFKKIVEKSFAYVNSKARTRIEKYFIDSQTILNATTNTIDAQLVIFIFQYALACLLMKIGVIPEYMLGHSLGEYVAACLADVISLSDCIDLIQVRGCLLESVVTGGQMIAVLSGYDDLKPHILPSISIAALNSNNQCVLSGAKDNIDEQKAILNEKGIFYIVVNGSYAFHSGLVKEIKQEMIAEFKKVGFGKPKYKIYSNVTGELFESVPDANYWFDHAASPVQFKKSILKLYNESNNLVVVDFSPHAMLTSLIKQSLPEHVNSDNIIQMLDVNHDILPAISQLYGFNLLTQTEYVFEGLHKKRIKLTYYPFDKSVYALPVHTESTHMKGLLYYVSVCDEIKIEAMQNSGAIKIIIGNSMEGKQFSSAIVVKNIDDFENCIQLNYDEISNKKSIEFIVCLGAQGVQSEPEILIKFYNQIINALVKIEKVEFLGLSKQLLIVIENDHQKSVISSLASMPNVILTEYNFDACAVIAVDKINSNLLNYTSSCLLLAKRSYLKFFKEAHGCWYEHSISEMPQHLSDYPVPGVKMKGVYVLIGGASGIGKHLIHCLLKHYDASVVVVSRYADISAFSNMSCDYQNVFCIKADVTDYQKMYDVKKQAIKRFGKIDGVMHLAGCPGGGLMSALDATMVQKTMAAKVQGAMVIEKVFANYPLDFVLYFSSLAVYLGGKAQIDYVLANAFLHGHCESSRLNSRVMAWDTWLDTGVNQSGILASGIAPTEGIKACLQCLSLRCKYIAITGENIYNRFPSAFPEKKFNSANEKNNNKISDEALSVFNGLLPLLRLFFSCEDITIHDNFHDLGGNSILAIQLVYKINDKWKGMDLMPDILLRYPNLTDLCQYISTKIFNVNVS